MAGCLCLTTRPPLLFLLVPVFVLLDPLPAALGSGAGSGRAIAVAPRTVIASTRSLEKCIVESVDDGDRDMEVKMNEWIEPVPDWKEVRFVFFDVFDVYDSDLGNQATQVRETSQPFILFQLLCRLRSGGE